MDRDELTLAISGALVCAVLLGWTLRWLFGRIDASSPDALDRSVDLAARLHGAEDARDRAEARLAAVEGDLKARLSEMQAELDRTHHLLDQARAQAEEIRAAYRDARSKGEAPD